MATLLYTVLAVLITSRYCQALTSCTGGFWLNAHVLGSTYIQSAPFPEAQSSTDFQNLFSSPISPTNTPGLMRFDRRTATVYWTEEGDPTSGDVIRRQTINGDTPYPDASTFVTGTQDAVVNYDITAMAFDETQQRLYWSEYDGTTTRTVWSIPLDGSAGDKMMIHSYTGGAGQFINDIELDAENQVIYWADDRVYRSEINDDGTLSSVNPFDVNIIDSSNIVAIELDLVSRKLYWAVGCNIGRIDIEVNTLNLNSNEVYGMYATPSGPCTAKITGMFLSVTEVNIYFLDMDYRMVFEIPIESAPTSTSSTAISSLPMFRVPGSVFLVPVCPSEITFSASTYTVVEGEEDFGVLVNRLGSIHYDHHDPVVFVRNYGGNATSPSDYSSIVDGIAQSVISTRIAFESGQDTSIKVPFVIHDDEVRGEGVETFIVELFDPLPYGRIQLGEIPRAVVSIVDKSSYLRFSSSTAEAREGDAPFSITIERVGNTDEYAEISLVATGGTAEAGTDFDPDIAIVVFYPNQTEAEAFIDIKDDQELESPEMFVVSFAQAQPTDVNTIEIHINDNEIGYSFQKAIYEVNEDVGTVTIPVERIGANEEDGRVDVVIGQESDTADKEEDYTEFNPTTLNFISGETIANIYIYITDDNLYESMESFKISISNPQPEGSDIDIDETTITIMDNEENVRFEDNTITVREGENAPLIIPIIRDIAIKETSVFVTTCQGYRSAVAGEDYAPITSAIVRFPVGQTIAYTPPIYILNDNQGEVYESFQVIITSQSQVVCNDAITNDIYVGIIDDDGVTFRFSSDNYVVAESTSHLKVRINRDGIPADESEEILLTVTSGTAMNNQDYIFVGPLTLNFGNKGYTDVLIQIVSDTEYEAGDESFNLELSNSAGEPLDTATATIIDDDSPAMPAQPQAYRFNEVSTTVAESAAFVRVRVFRTQTSSPATVFLNTVSESAEEGTDYLAPSSIPLYFSAGTVLVDQVIAILDDDEVEDDESFQISLSSPSDGGSIVGGAMTVTITDDDGDDDTGSALSGAVLAAIVAGIIAAVLLFGALICICYVSMLRTTVPRAAAQNRGLPQQYGRAINY